MRGLVVPYRKATLELFEAFVNIDFDFASKLQKKHKIFKVLKVKQINFIVETFIVFRPLYLLFEILCKMYS